MKKLILILFVILSTLSYSQEPFRYDTIRVSRDDTRNIHQQKQNQPLANQNRQIQRGTSEPEAKIGFDAKKLRYGLNLGLNFSNNYSLFRLAPQVGYQFNEYVMAGVGVSYYHSKQRVYFQSERVNDYINSLGANAFAYLYPVKFIAFSVQPEFNYIWASSEGDVSGTYNKRKALVPSVVVGAGLRLGSAHAMIYYDLVQDVNSPYSSGVFYGVSVYF